MVNDLYIVVSKCSLPRWQLYREVEVGMVQPVDKATGKPLGLVVPYKEVAPYVAKLNQDFGSGKRLIH